MVAKNYLIYFFFFCMVLFVKIIDRAHKELKKKHFKINFDTKTVSLIFLLILNPN